MGFKEASKKDIKIKMAVAALSGGGKSYGALKIAKGLVDGDMSKIGVLQTEAGRVQLYAGFGPFQVMEIEPPFTPEKFIAGIEEAEKAGFKVLIIDSASDEWSGLGGCLDIHQEYADQLKNTFSAWKRVTPRHENLFNKILSSKLHIIATFKKKADYVLETNEKGKQVPKKLGLADVCREGTEYRFMIHFDIDLETHLAKATKDNTGLFEGRAPFVLSEETGLEIRNWCLETK